MRLEDPASLNVCLTTGKPRQRIEWSGEASLGAVKAGTRLQLQYVDDDDDDDEEDDMLYLQL
jgi:hypothetical protein